MKSGFSEEEVIIENHYSPLTHLNKVLKMLLASDGNIKHVIQYREPLSW